MSLQPPEFAVESEKTRLASKLDGQITQVVPLVTTQHLSDIGFLEEEYVLLAPSIY